jgi:PPOX class probable F420-dependent enzyme
VRKPLAVSELGDLLELPLLAVLATRRVDGGLLLSPVWHRWRDGGFDVVSRSDDVKVRHLRRDPRANIVVCEHVRPYRGLELRCEARFVTDRVAEAVAPIAMRYMGLDAGRRYAETEPDDILIRLEPGVVRGWDFADDWPVEG